MNIIMKIKIEDRSDKEIKQASDDLIKYKNKIENEIVNLAIENNIERFKEIEVVKIVYYSNISKTKNDNTSLIVGIVVACVIVIVIVIIIIISIICKKNSKKENGIEEKEIEKGKNVTINVNDKNEKNVIERIVLPPTTNEIKSNTEMKSSNQLKSPNTLSQPIKSSISNNSNSNYLTPKRKNTLLSNRRKISVTNNTNINNNGGIKPFKEGYLLKEFANENSNGEIEFKKKYFVLYKENKLLKMYRNMNKTDYGNLYLNGELEIDLKCLKDVKYNDLEKVIDLLLKVNETIRDGILVYEVGEKEKKISLAVRANNDILKEWYNCFKELMES